jgi:hypothetical protein
VKVYRDWEDELGRDRNVQFFSEDPGLLLMAAGLRALRLGAGLGAAQTDRDAWIGAFFSRAQRQASLAVVARWQGDGQLPVTWANVVRQVLCDDIAIELVGNFVRAVMRNFIEDEHYRSLEAAGEAPARLHAA